MRTLGNILWHFPFLGFIDALVTGLIGFILTITVVGAPLGLGLIELGRFLMLPFGREMVRARDLEPAQQGGLWGTYSWIVMILWLPVGAVIAFSMILQAFLLCLTIIGIPLAIVIAKSVGTVFNPVGKRCVSTEVGNEMRRRAASEELNGIRNKYQDAEPEFAASWESADDPAALTGRTEVKGREIVASTALPKKVKLGGALIVALIGTVWLGPKVMNGARTTPTASMTTAISTPPVQTTPKASPAGEKPKTREVLSGVADVADTATLTVNGRRLTLAGLQPVQRAEATAAARAYLAQAGSVKCDLVVPDGWRCIVVSKDLDVAEVFALSGFAKATENAPDFIRKAESMAREGRRGIWGAS